MKVVVPIGSEIQINECYQLVLTNGETPISRFIDGRSTFDGWKINPNHIIKSKKVYQHQISIEGLTTNPQICGCIITKIDDERYQIVEEEVKDVDNFISKMGEEGWDVVWEENI